MKKRIRLTGIVVLVAAIGIQFVRPERSNPPEDPANTLVATAAVPPAVQEIINRSCMDCHSHRTNWPWYSNIAPASWLVASDVRKARKDLNLSEWGTYKTKRKIARLDMIVSEVDKGDMPPSQYLLIHRSAALSDSERSLLCDWAEHLSDSLKSLSSRE